MSHHLLHVLQSGEHIYVDYRQAVVVAAIRRCNRASQDQRQPAESDVQLIERFARQCPDALCDYPFDTCAHEA